MNWSEVHQAVECGDADRVKLLVLQHGVDVNSISVRAQWCRDVTFAPYTTPLHIAAALGSLPMVRLLVDQCGARVDAEDKFSRTPLYLASWLGHVDVVEFLAFRNANVNKAKTYGASPMHKAALKDGGTRLIDVLYAFGASLELADVGDATPLVDAVAAGKEEAVGALLRLNACTTTRNVDGQTLIDTTKNERIRAMLREQQARSFEERDDRRRAELCRVRAELGVHLMRYAQADIVSICIALAPLELPPYVLLWILDWLPRYELLSELRKLRLIEAVRESIRRCRTYS